MYQVRALWPSRVVLFFSLPSTGARFAPPPDLTPVLLFSWVHITPHRAQHDLHSRLFTLATLMRNRQIPLVLVTPVSTILRMYFGHGIK